MSGEQQLFHPLKTITIELMVVLISQYWKCTIDRHSFCDHVGGLVIRSSADQLFIHSKMSNIVVVSIENTAATNSV